MADEIILPPSCHPDVVTRFQKSELPEVDAARSALSQLYDALGRIAIAAEQIRRDPMRTPMQQAADIRDFAHRVFAGAAKAVDHVTGRIDVATDDHNYEADVHLENGPHDPEIRAHASRLPEKQRGDFLEKAVVENDLVTLSALLTGPPYLSGLTAAQTAMARARYRAKHSPKSVAALKVLPKLRETLVRAGQAGLGFVTSLYDAAELERAEEAATEARQATYQNPMIAGDEGTVH